MSEPKSHNRRLRACIRRIRRFLEDKRYHPRINVMLDRVVLAHVSKAVKVSEAVVCLVDAGFDEEAFGLSRTLVEVAFNLRFVLNRDSERRAKRFAHYAAKWKLELLGRVLKHSTIQDAQGRTVPKYTKAQLRKLTVDYKDLIRWARKYAKRPPSAHWAGKKWNARQMALEASRAEKKAGPVDWAFDYEWIYFWTSQYVHATAACMDSHVVMPREAFLVQIAPGRIRGAGTSALVNTALYLHKILTIAFPALGTPFPSQLSRPLEEFLADVSENEPEG